MTYAFIGLMVSYRLTAEDAEKTNMRRKDARQNAGKMRVERPGFQAHVGSDVSEGERVPMVITHMGTWDGPLPFINGQAFLNGNDSLWVTGVLEGEDPGEWEAITDG